MGALIILTLRDFYYEEENLVEDNKGEYFRQWRDHIKSPEDIWEEIISAGQYSGTYFAPKLQPIQTRLVMLQTGMRAPMGIKVYGPDLETIEKVGFEIEKHLKQVEGVEGNVGICRQGRRETLPRIKN